MEHFQSFINEFIFIISLFLFLTLIIIIIYIGRIILQKRQLDHEYKITVLEFNQKKEWEDIITKKTNQKKDEDWIKEKDELKKRVDNLWEKQNNISPVDMNRVALLHLVLCGSKEAITAENMEKEIAKIKGIYEIIKNQLNK